MESLGRLNRDSIVGEPRRLHDEYEASHLLEHAADFVGLNLSERGQSTRVSASDIL